MNTAEKYRNQFEEESLKFRDFLEQIQENPESIVKGDPLFDELFRTAHSLKSGAGFLNLHNLETAAHKLEDILDNPREDLMTKSLMQDSIGNVLSFLYKEDLGGNKPPAVNSVEGEDIPYIEAQSGKRNLSDFDLLLLEEARFRGEKLYRINCRIDREEPMKRARAYLVLNKMELHCNVIKTEPSMEDENSSFTPFILYITSKKNRTDIKKLLNFDRIEGIDIQEFSLNELDNIRLGDEIIFSGIMEEKKNRLSIDRDDLEDLLSLWDELTLSLKDETLYRKRDTRMEKILAEGSRKLQEISCFTIQEIFPELKERVEDYGKRIRKQAELSIKGEQVSLPREWMSPILRILQQLVRNSLVHGIENAEERIELGKVPTGRLNLSLKEEKGHILLEYSDDGKGIDEGQLRKKVASSPQSQNFQDKSLLQLIMTRGLSSSKKADTFSGRGIGMDLLYQAVENELHGRLGLENFPGEGLRFIIEIPFSQDQTYLQFRYRGAVYLVERKFIRETGTLNIDSLYKNKKGHYHMKEKEFIPLFSVNGSINDISDLKSCPFWLKLRYMGKTACLLAEDLMVEKTLRIATSFPGASGSLQRIDNQMFLVLPNLIE